MLRPFDVKTPAGRRALGEAAVQGRSDRANSAPHCPTIAQHRTDSIRLLVIGQIGGAA